MALRSLDVAGVAVHTIVVEWGGGERKGRQPMVLHEFLESKHGEIIGRTKAKVAARAVARATETELTRGVPMFVDHLVDIRNILGSRVEETQEAGR